MQWVMRLLLMQLKRLCWPSPAVFSCHLDIWGGKEEGDGKGKLTEE